MGARCWDSDGGRRVDLQVDQMTHQTASILSYFQTCIPHTHTYKHYILYSLMLAFISLPETSHGEPGPVPTHKQVIQSIFPSPVPASLYRMFLDKNVSLPSCTGHESKTE